MAMKIIPKKISASEVAFIIEVNGEIKDVCSGCESLNMLIKNRFEEIEEA